MSTTDPNQYCAYGMALLDGGICQVDAYNGVGLVTRGLVWQGPWIWWDQQDKLSGYTLVTGWTAALGYSGSSIAYVTTWTASQFYEWGEFPSSQ